MSIVHDPARPLAGGDARVVPSQCLTCINTCGVLVEVADGAVRRVTGDPDNPVSRGYTCVKGRAQPQLLRSPDRLLSPQRRRADGTYEAIGSVDAIDEIASRLQHILDRDGPGAVALYFGTALFSCLGTVPFASAFMEAIGSRLQFSTNTIDKGGRHVAAALQGSWMAPRQAWDRPEVALLIGINPLVSYQGFPAGHVGKWLAENLARGMRLIVVDPRTSDVARRAHLHLQSRPGTDAAVLAAMLHVILDEGLGDPEFVAAHTVGVDALRAAVRRFAPAAVAPLAGLDVDDLVRAAREFGHARRGFAVAGTGPHMAGQGTLTEYLLLDLEAVCGHYLRAGEVVRNPGTLIPTMPHRAQAVGPRQAIGFGSFRTRNLTTTVAGSPTAILPDEILLAGEGQIRALICVAGNPVTAIPGKRKVVDALRDLELLVTIDPWMTETARLAHYVIAPTMWPEAPSVSYLLDHASLMAPGYGLADSYAQYSPAAVDPPPGADVMPDWAFFHRLARRMDLQLVLGAGNQRLRSAHVAEVDMTREPTAEEVLDMITAGSRIPLEEVRRHPHGALFPAPQVVVDEAEPGWQGRLDLADADMLQDLAGIDLNATAAGRHFRLVARRMQHVHNSVCNVEATNRGRFHNPAFLHPDDLADLGVAADGLVEISNEHGRIVGVVHPDPHLRRGLVSMAHCFGDLDPETEAADPLRRGASTNWLTANDDVFDRYTGQPLMTNIPVDVTPIAEADVVHP